MADYLDMTALPEGLEKALLALPNRILARECGWELTSDKYVSIQKLAKLKTPVQLWELVKTAKAEPPEPIEATKTTSPVSRVVVPKAARTASTRISAETVVKAKGGWKEGVRPTSSRGVFLAKLQEIGGTATLSQLGADAKPIAQVLLRMGWLEIVS